MQTLTEQDREQSASTPRVPNVRASQLLKVPRLWATVVVIASIVVVVMSALYIGSVVNPTGHLDGLPVSIVNEDTGVTVSSRELDFGERVQSGLADSRVSRFLSLQPETLAGAETAMDTGKLYAAIVIPPQFTGSLLALSAPRAASAMPAGQPTIRLLTNNRAGTEGVALATAVVQPAIASVSRQIGRQLLASASRTSAAARLLLAAPVAFSTVAYHPLPSHSALGLSAFFTALLTMLCGFLGAIIVNSAIDTALGYAAVDSGPRYGHRQPVLISRTQTLLCKWAIAFVLTGILCGLMLVVAAGLLAMNAPDPGELWLFSWLAAASVATGTLALIAILGTPGQLIAMLLFVYLGLASAGGTFPLQALPGVLRLVNQVEPLRQILSGTRSILYFGAKGNAGLTGGVVAAASGLIFWLVIGTAVVRWYDRRGLHRIAPATLAYIQQVAHPGARQDDISPERVAESHGSPVDRPERPEATDGGNGL